MFKNSTLYCWPMAFIRQKMGFAKVLKHLVTLICLSLCIHEFITIVNKSIRGDSFQSINELHFEELLAPVLTLCPGIGQVSF